MYVLTKMWSDKIKIQQWLQIPPDFLKKTEWLWGSPGDFVSVADSVPYGMVCYKLCSHMHSICIEQVCTGTHNIIINAYYRYLCFRSIVWYTLYFKKGLRY